MEYEIHVETPTGVAVYKSRCATAAQAYEDGLSRLNEHPDALAAHLVHNGTRLHTLKPRPAEALSPFRSSDG